MANLEQTTSVNLKLSRILMAWDLVQTNMIDSWTDMLVMKKKKNHFEARLGPNIYTLLHSNQLMKHVLERSWTPC